MTSGEPATGRSSTRWRPSDVAGAGRRELLSRRERPRGTFQATTLITGALLLMILFVSAGYFFWLLPGGGRIDETSRTIDSHVARWRASEPASYRYVVRRSCDCGREYLAAYVVTVAGGTTSASFPIPVEASGGDFLDTPPEPDTIDDIFAVIRDSSLDGLDVSVGYDRRRGYPVAVTIRSPGSTRGWEIRDFETLQPTGQ